MEKSQLVCWSAWVNSHEEGNCSSLAGSLADSKYISYLCDKKNERVCAKYSRNVSQALERAALSQKKFLSLKVAELLLLMYFSNALLLRYDAYLPLRLNSNYRTT